MQSEWLSSKSCESELLGAELAATTGLPHSTTTTGMLDRNCWRESSCLVDVFRRVGKMGGKASLTTSTENGLWASLDIQTNP